MALCMLKKFYIIYVQNPESKQSTRFHFLDKTVVLAEGICCAFKTISIDTRM